MNEVVKYDNYMNALHFGTFTKQDYNFFMALCARAREMEDTEICLEFSYIKEISGYKRKSSDDFLGDPHALPVPSWPDRQIGLVGCGRRNRFCEC